MSIGKEVGLAERLCSDGMSTLKTCSERDCALQKVCNLRLGGSKEERAKGSLVPLKLLGKEQGHRGYCCPQVGKKQMRMAMSSEQWQ